MSNELPTEPIRIRAGDDVVLDGDLAVPPDVSSVVVFAHGSGSGRHSPRNQYVAAALNRAGFATLLMDLLSAAEDAVDLRTREHRFDIPLLAQRLGAAVDSLADDHRTAGLPVLLYGASTGAAAALITAADRSDRVRGVVSRGGRPDLAGDALRRVRVPTLFVVGGNDPSVVTLNRQAERAIVASGGTVELVVVAGATHLFEEPGALDAVIDATVDRLQRWTTAQS